METLAAVLCLLAALMAPLASSRHLHIAPNISPTTFTTTTMATLLVVMATMAPLASAQLRPPNLSPDNLPDTAFTCEDKVTGGYYADMEADCQLFHVCVQVSEYEFQDFHFLCPNDTVFDQQHLVCTNWFEVDCHAQLAFFSNDFGIKRSGGGGGGVGEDEDARQGSHSSERDQGLGGFGGQSGIVGRNRNTGRGQLEVGRRRPVQHRSHSQRRFPVRPSSDYEDTDVDSEVLEEAPRAAEPPPRDPARIAAITGSTPLPQFFTTTVRPSRAISSSGLLSGRNLRTTTTRTTTTIAPVFPQPRETQEPAGPKTIQPFVNFGRDGRKPHVKSNIRAKLANSGSGSRKKFFSKLNQQKIRKKAGHKVALGNRGRKEIKFVAPTEEKPTTQTFSGPEVRPDGRAPRVKANLRRDEAREDSQQREEEPEQRTLAPFVEQFFASPSSPKPFIFTGSPEPRLRGADTLLTSAPEESFLPTVQPDSTFGPATDLLPPESREQGSSSSFLARPPSAVNKQRSRFRGRNRVVVKSTVPSFAVQEEQDSASESFSSEEPNSLETVPTRPTKSKPRVKSNLRSRGKFGKSSSSSLNSVTSEVDCSNPFLCPPKSTAAGRRPRVKSNVRAKKRNFWHGAGSTGPVGGRRKIRRGRKILRKPDNVQISNEISNEIEADIEAHTEGNSLEEETEQFIPTVRTFATTTPRPATRRTTTTPEPVDDFEDFFDSENDLFVASSTVSSVVFKGSPTPGGWASSPAPNFDGSGVQVSFSSPSPYGFGPSGRPSFNNIGAHVDLGPKKKILAPEQLFFISSTMSNKIFIGDPEEDTVTEPTVVVDDAKNDENEDEEEDKSSSRFSSFPIRGLNTLAGPKGSSNGLLPFRPRKSPFLHFGRNHKKTKKEEEKTEAPALDLEEEEEEGALTTVTEKPEETSTRAFKPVTRKGPRVKSNLLFNRRKPGGISSGRNKFAGKISGILSTPAATTTTTESSTDREEDNVPTTTVATSLEPEEEEGERREKRPNIASRFKSSNLRRPFGGVRPGLGFPRPPISFTNALLAKRKLRGGKKEKEEVATEEEEVEDEVSEVTTTVAPAPSTSTVFTAFGSSSSSASSSSDSSPTSSVAEELFSDDESITNEIEPEAKPFSSGPRSILSGFRKPRKWPSVKKAKAAPPNGNIRVEFKKASAVAAEEGSKPTFVKPDGRKPRVKANIRARKAHRGIFGQPQAETSVTGFRHSTKVTTNEEAFAEASSQLALAPPYTGDEEDEEEEEKEMVDNTEKREVNINAGLNEVDDVDVHAKPNSQSFIHLPNLQPVILNSRQDRRSQGPPLPPDVLARIQHITDIHNLPPLPNGARPFGPGPQRSPRVKSDVLRRKQTSVAEDRIDINSNEQPSLLHQLVPAVSTSSSVSSSSSTSSSFSTSSSSAPQLSAFRALVEQTEKGVSDSPV